MDAEKNNLALRPFDFSSSLDQEAYALLERLLEEKVSDGEIEEIAKNFVRNLKYHLAEG